VTYLNNPTVTEWHRQIILGTVLGGSSIVLPRRGRNCYLAMRSKDGRWLKYKADELSELAASQSPCRVEKQTIRWHSSCYPIFSEMRRLLYDGDGNRLLSVEILNPLKDIGMAVWYCDRGRVIKGRAVINTFMYGVEGTEVAVRYFNEVGIECEVFRQRGKPRVRMTTKGTQDLFRIIAHRVPVFMLPRIARVACPTEGRTPSHRP
jgi:hypothetical protein